MPSIKESIETLTNFLMPNTGNVRLILDELHLCEASPEKIEEKTLESLRNQLNAILSDDGSARIIVGSLSFADAAYNALIALAELKPINDIDPITQEEVII